MYMKRYILFGLSLLMSFPLAVSAQDDDTDDDAVDTTVRTFTVKKKQYETRTIKGHVFDAATKQPISGAIVKAADIDGYSVLTDDDGSYELKLPLFSTAIVVTSPEYNGVRQGLVKEESQRATMLHSTAFTADYGQQVNVRSDYSATDFKYSSAINIKEEIQTQLGSQVHTINRNGTPGVGGVMFVQGLNSLNANAQPLVVIDDVIIDQQYGRELLHDGFYNDILTSVSPADIEKVTVLRNGTALYGAKGANGVIIIQTRRNKSMATRITATASAGVTMKPEYYSVMNAEQYRGYASEMLKSTNTKLTSFKFLDPNEMQENGQRNVYYPVYHQNTDWKDLVYHTAITQNYGINVEGGDDVANYNLSVGYMNAQSTLKMNDMDRLSVRFNTDISLTKNLAVRFDASFVNQTRDIRSDGAPESYDNGTPVSPAYLAYVKSPFLSPYSYANYEFSAGHFNLQSEDYLTEALANYTNLNWKLANPATILEYGEAENKNRFENSMLNLTVTPKYSFSRNLSLSEHFSYNLVNTNEMFYIPVNGTPSYYITSIGDWRDNEVRSLASRQNSVMSDTRLNWFNRYDAHYVQLFGGVRINWESFSSNTQVGYNTGNDKTPFMRADLKNVSVNGVSESWNSMAWYAQAEYNYMSRYFLQGNLTVESSSRFGRDADGLRLFSVPWAVFPSLQASWVLTNEEWLAGIKGLDYLRLSIGYDISGNDDINYYAARSYFRSDNLTNAIAGLSLSGIGNSKIQWETTRRLNVGLESNLINNRLNVGVNYFRSTTDNLLVYETLGYLTGLDSRYWSNDGKLQNEGFDVHFTAKVLELKDWKWQLGASVGHYKNKITALPGGQSKLDNTVYGATIRTAVGQPANLFYGFRTEGVFATTDQAVSAGNAGENGLYQIDENGAKQYFAAGDMHFSDLSGDGIISDGSDGNADDRVVIGDPNPDIYGNIFTSVSWKRFKLDVRFNYSLGNDVFNYMRYQLESGSRFMNQTTAMLRHWQAEGQQTDMPRITFQDPMGNSRFSDRWIEDGSYLRLKNVTLSYDLPLKSEYIQGLQFWIQGNNLLTFTKYLGTDPEFSMTSSVIGQGIDLGCLSSSRSIVAGVKINL